MDLTASFLDRGDLNAKQNGRTWGRRQASRSKSGEEMLAGEDQTLEKRMEKELIAAQEAGNDVDRLVMKKLLAGVRDSGPNTAYKALASIEVRCGAVWGRVCGVLSRYRRVPLELSFLCSGEHRKEQENFCVGGCRL